MADITFVAIDQGFVYLAVILDACSRKVVGWALSRRIDTELTLAALIGGDRRQTAYRPEPAFTTAIGEANTQASVTARP